MGKINAIARITINEGQLETLLANAEKAVAIVREKDPGTLKYDWNGNTGDGEFVAKRKPEKKKSEEEYAVP